MVQTRKQADAEAETANPSAPVSTVKPVRLTPAPAPPEKKAATKASPKKATPKETAPRNTSPKAKKGITGEPSIIEDASDDDDMTGDGRSTKKRKMPAIKKGRVKATPEKTIEAPSNGNETKEVNNSAEPAKTKKRKAAPKAKRRKRSTENNTSKNYDAQAEPRKKEAIAKGPAKPRLGYVLTNSETDSDGTDKSGSYEKNMADYKKRQRKLADFKRKAPVTEAGEGQLFPEPPKKKTKRSVTWNAVTEEDGPKRDPHDGAPVDGSPKRAVAATKRAAKAPKPQAEPVTGTRQSARIKGRAGVSSSGDEENRLLKNRFNKRVKTPEIPDNRIGLRKEIFDPRFPIAKATKRTRSGGGFAMRAEQRTSTWERTLSAWERTTIEWLTERLIVPTEPRIGNRPHLADGPLRVRFEQRSLDSSGHGITELGMEDSEVQMPSLTNEIHPIWASRNFAFSKGPSGRHRAHNRRAYNAISPALRLASHWIEEPVFEEFWHTLWVGGLSHNKKAGVVTISTSGPGGVYGDTSFEQLKVARHKEPARQNAASLLHELAELESLEWRFEPTEIELPELENLGGKFQPPAQTKYVGLSKTRGQVSTFPDWFERDILYDSNLPPDSTRTISERLRVLFLLAVHLCRQLVQQVYHHKWAKDFKDTPPPHISKVLFENAPGISDYLEVSWDTFMFTGPIVKINHHKNTQVDCPDGLAIALGRRAPEWKNSPSPKTFAALPMRWIKDLFQDEFWSQKGRGSCHPRLPDGDHPYCAVGPFT